MESALLSFRECAKVDEESNESELSEERIVLTNGRKPGEDGITAEIFNEHKVIVLP